MDAHMGAENKSIPSFASSGEATPTPARSHHDREKLRAGTRTSNPGSHRVSTAHRRWRLEFCYTLIDWQPPISPVQLYQPIPATMCEIWAEASRGGNLISRHRHPNILSHSTIREHCPRERGETIPLKVQIQNMGGWEGRTGNAVHSGLPRWSRGAVTEKIRENLHHIGCMKHHMSGTGSVGSRRCVATVEGAENVRYCSLANASHQLSQHDVA